MANQRAYLYALIVGCEVAFWLLRGGELIVLLAGGDKSSQAKDIKAAIALAMNL